MRFKMDRIYKPLICLFCIPFLLAMLLFVAVMVLTLPLFAIIYPEKIKIGEVQDD